VGVYGGRYVGAERAALSLSYTNPLGSGDRVNLLGAYSEGSSYVSAGYDLPVNYVGTRLFFSGYRMNYDLIDDFEALGAHGKTTGGEVGLMHSFVRTSRHSLSGRFTYAQKSIEDRITLTASSNEREASTYAMQLDGATNDRLLGATALNRVSLGYTTGNVNIQDPLSHLIDAATARSDGSFDKLTYWLSRDQQLTRRWSWYTRVTGQVATDNLDSSEKFYLGGPSAVRAYPVGEAAGDRGYLASAEIRRMFTGPFAGFGQAAIFHDYGRVRTDARPWTDGERDRSLRGYGLGVDWNHPAGWSLASSIALRGSDAVRSGPNRNYQLWMSGGYRF
jgi:hemolysin activation/secretion protein